MSDRTYLKTDLFFDIHALPLLVLEMLLDECSSDRRSTNPKAKAVDDDSRIRSTSDPRPYNQPLRRSELSLCTNLSDPTDAALLWLGGDLRHLGVCLFIPLIAVRSGGAYSR